MTLNKRYKRDLKHNMSLYVTSTLLTVLSLLLFYLYYISGTGIINYADYIFKEQNIEDAHFGTYIEIPDTELELYENKYNVSLEKQKYINIETDGITTRVFEISDKIDIPFVTKGKYPEKDNEIAVSEGYAAANNISVGDKVNVRGKNYTITAYIERPDYLYMLQNENDTDKNVNSFFISYMTSEEFQSLGNKSVQYLIKYNNNADTESLRKDINESYIMSFYSEAEDNHRILMLKSQPELFIQMAYAVLFTLPLMAVILISIILSRKIRSEQKMIGTLAAYGYTKKQIIRHYAGFSAIPGIAGGIITTIIVGLAADSYGALGLMDYEPLKAEFTLKVPQMIMGIMVPTVMYILSTSFTVNRLLKHNITELLTGSVKGKEHTKKFLVGKNVSFRTKFSVRSIIGNKGRTFALFIGVFLGGYVIMWGFSAYDTLSNMGTATAESMGSYNYQYTLNELNMENPYGGETVLVAGAEDNQGNNIAVYGCDNNTLLKMEDDEGNSLDPENGYIATSLYAELSGVEEGDSIIIKNPLSLEEYSIKITGIASNNFLSAVYTSVDNVSEISGIDGKMYNMILSKDKLEIPDEKVETLVIKSQIEDLYRALIKQMNVIVYTFLIIGIFLCIASVYIVVNMIITENKTNISMLQVLGYSDKKINKLLIRDNIIVAIAAAIISLPCAVVSVDVLFRSFIDILGYRIEAYVTPESYILSLLLVLVSYSISVFFVKRKTGKTDMVESLKDNRE